MIEAQAVIMILQLVMELHLLLIYAVRASMTHTTAKSAWWFIKGHWMVHHILILCRKIMMHHF